MVLMIQQLKQLIQILFEQTVYICYRQKGKIIANNLKLSISMECRYDLVYYLLKWTGEKIDFSSSIDKYIGMLL